MDTTPPAGYKVLAVYTVIFACGWRGKYRKCEETFGLLVKPVDVDDWDYVRPLISRILMGDKHDYDEGFGFGYSSVTVHRILRCDIKAQPKGIQVFNEDDFE